MNIEQFKKGMRVKYIPSNLLTSFTDIMKDPAAIINHKDCQTGVVSSINDRFVFVKYDLVIGTFKGPQNEIKQYLQMKTGDEPYTAEATKPEDLVIL